MLERWTDSGVKADAEADERRTGSSKPQHSGLRGRLGLGVRRLGAARVGTFSFRLTRPGSWFN